MSQIKDSLCIITGGGSGIGRALATAFQERGAKVIIGDIVAEEMEETRRLAGEKVQAFALDVTDPLAISSFRDKVLDTYPQDRIILINNAGVNLASGYFSETPLDDFDWLMQVNLWGVVRMTQAFLPHMLKQQAGHIVNVSSMLGYAATARSAAYCTAKFAVKGFSDVLKSELMGSGIGVSSVHPGGVRTNIIRKSRVSDHLDAKKTWNLLHKIEERSLTIPASRAAEIIFRGIEKNRSRILVGKDAVATDWLVRIFPDNYHRLLEGLLKKM